MSEAEFNRILQTAWPDWFYLYVLGRGTYGTVILAGRQDGRRAAVKMINIRTDRADAGIFPESSSVCYMKDTHGEAVESCLREIALQRSLAGHPNIVALEDSAVLPDEDGSGCTVLIRMEQLRPIRDMFPLSEKDVYRMGCDICDALCACAEKNILHRDIKPDNIFYAPDGSCKLGDFGISRLQESGRTEMTVHMGTPMNMAPEMSAGTRYDSRADLYSLGLVMYTLLNDGRGPFLPADKHLLSTADRLDAQTKRLRGDPLPPAKNASPEMSRFLAKSCAFRPGDRWQSAQEMRSALRTLYTSDTAPAFRRKHIRICAAAALSAAFILYLSLRTTPEPTVSDNASPVLPETEQNDSVPATTAVTAVSAVPADTDPQPALSPEGAIVWNDPNLEACIRDILGKPEGAILPEDVITVSTLTLKAKQITDISALQYFTNLTDLHLTDNLITDIRPLAALTRITVLDISLNYISDISSLSSLKNLERLNMRSNRITDLSPIAGLTKMRVLDFVNNKVTDLSPLKDMGKLQRLVCAANGIRDINVLAGMPYLMDVNLKYNKITDLTPVSHVSAKCLLNISGNPLEDLTPVAHVTLLVTDEGP